MFSLEIEPMIPILPMHDVVQKEGMPSGKMIIFTGPSGVGKGALLKSLLQRHPELYLSISVTTRSPRAGEIDGKHYYFVNRNQFEEMVARSELLEWAEFAGNYYGTPRIPVEQQVSKGKCVLLEIELEGARKIRESFPSTLSIFILPPSLEELERRIRIRSLDSEEAIARRLCRAKEEVNAASEFNFQITNDNFDTALNCIEAALTASCC